MGDGEEQVYVPKMLAEAATRLQILLATRSKTELRRILAVTRALSTQTKDLLTLKKEIGDVMGNDNPVQNTGKDSPVKTDVRVRRGGGAVKILD